MNQKPSDTLHVQRVTLKVSFVTFKNLDTINLNKKDIIVGFYSSGWD